MLLEKFKSAFSSPIKPSDTKVRARNAIRLIVAKRSHGNLRLQKGKYYTKKDIDQQYAKIKPKRFSGS